MPRAKTVSDDELVAAIVNTNSISCAARRCGLSIGQMYERRKAPEVAKKLKDIQRSALLSATQHLQYNTNVAAETLVQIAANTNEAGQVRVTAARAILVHALSLLEAVDFSERLDRLEAIARGDHHE